MNRKLIIPDQFAKIMNDLEVIGKMINSYINSIGEVSEPFEHYRSELPPIPST